MSDELKKGKDGWRNQVKSTLPPKYKKLVSEYAEANDMAKSEVVKVIVRSFFDNMSDEQLRRMNRHSPNSY